MIFALSKSAKVNWGLKHATLKIIDTGAILPLLLHGAPVWKKTIDKASYKLKLIGVQRLINIRIAKSYRTVPNEALCILTGLTLLPLKLRRQFNSTNTSEEAQNRRYWWIVAWVLNTGITPQKR